MPRLRFVIAGLVAAAVVVVASVGAYFVARALMAWSSGRNDDGSAQPEAQQPAHAHAAAKARQERSAHTSDDAHEGSEQESPWQLSAQEQRAAQQRQARLFDSTEQHRIVTC